MADQREKQTHHANAEGNHAQLGITDEKEIEMQHQYQMFPTPDEKVASEAITELKD